MGITIERLDCGTLSAERTMFEATEATEATERHGGGDRPDPDFVTLPVPAWLVRHPAGTVLFDCGMHTELTRPGPLLDTVGLFFDVGLDAERTLDGGPLPPHAHDLQQQAASIAGLVERRRRGARLVPGHDPEVLAALPPVIA